MSFKHSAFIENTPEAREWLESIGYTIYVVEDCSKFILTLQKRGLGLIVDYPNTPPDKNCSGNLPLFKAITAIRDDSDYMQMFYNQYYNEWSICEEDSMFDYFRLDWCTHARKGSLQELQEHFKKK